MVATPINDQAVRNPIHSNPTGETAKVYVGIIAFRFRNPTEKALLNRNLPQYG
jgi:vancomycin resistance protein YoaR